MTNTKEDKSKKKIVCSVQPLKKNERRGTMMECAKKRQIRYYGIKKVDNAIIDMLTNKKKRREEEAYFHKVVARASFIRTMTPRLKKKLEIAKNKNNKTKIKYYEDQLEKLNKEYKDLMPIANKLIRERNKRNSEASK